MSVGMNAMMGVEGSFDPSAAESEPVKGPELSAEAQEYLRENKTELAGKVIAIRVFSEVDESGLGVYTADEMEYSGLDFNTTYKRVITYTDGRIERTEDTYAASQRGTPGRNNYSTKVTGATLVVIKTTQTTQDDKCLIVTTQNNETLIKETLK